MRPAFCRFIRKFHISLLLALALTSLLSCAALAVGPPILIHPATTEGQSEISFNGDWRFIRQDVAGAENPTFDDSQWRQIDLPHDWSVEDLPGQDQENIIGPFDRNSPGGTSTGYTVGGTGWYRKTFVMAPGGDGARAFILFDGVYMNSEVWLNGKRLGDHAYGYTPFHFELTPFLKPDGDANVLAVRVRNEGKNSRWYSGSGIYRSVKMVQTGQAAMDPWGVSITTPEVNGASASVMIKIEGTDKKAETDSLKISCLIKDGDGAKIGQIEKEISVQDDGQFAFAHSFFIKNPSLWSPYSPTLYQAEVTLKKSARLSQKKFIPFGVRSIAFSAEKGFLLNGTPLLLQGGCIHHDNGLLGSAAIRRAEERKIELLKARGYSAIRTSHNPPSEALLNACDRLGMVVIDEAFDMWQKPKNPEDYSLSFDAHWQKDLQAMILRDQNHPSIIMWSIGNEIFERGLPAGLEIEKRLVHEVHRLDPTRPVTEAMCKFWDQPNLTWKDLEAGFALLDVGGYNYEWARYEEDHKKFPLRIMAGTESFPKEAFENWKAVEDCPWVIGDFVWTAIDYMGETAIGHAILDDGPDGNCLTWPWYNANCGDIDLIGGQKPQSIYRDVLWRQRRLALAVHAPLPEGRKEKLSLWGWPDEYQSWTWPGAEGRPLQVNIYSRCPVVRLELNGRVVGEKAIDESTTLTATFQVPYEAGEIKALGIENGVVVETASLITAGPAKALRLTPDRAVIGAGREDLAYVTVEVTDEKGTLVPNDSFNVRFSLEGPGELAATGNANPKEPASFHQGASATFQGRCLAIVRPLGAAGAITLKAEVEGLAGATVTIQGR